MASRRSLAGLAFALLWLLPPGCGDDPRPDKPLPTDNAPPDKPDTPEEKKKPRRIMIDQIVISFDKAARSPRGDDPDFRSGRTAAEAEQLAKRLLDRIEVGADFSALKNEYSDARVKSTGRAERPFYIYNKGVRPRAVKDYGVVAWDACFAGPRTVGFSLEPGKLGLAPYHVRNCPQGWFIIKRLK